MLNHWSLHRRSPTLLTFDLQADVPACAGAGAGTAVERKNGSLPAVCDCVALDGDYLNIAHSAQVLFKCWSYFDSLDRNVERLLLDSFDPWRRRISEQLSAKPWQVVQVMCGLQFSVK